MGRIGQKIAKIAKSLGMIIHYHNRSKLNDEKADGATYHDSIKSLFSVSDVLSICLLYTSPSPRDATLSRMPSSA